MGWRQGLVAAAVGTYLVLLVACGGKGGGGAGSGGSPPTAVSFSATTQEDMAVALTLSGSGSSSLTYSIKSSPANGTLAGSAPSLFYTPNHNFNGSDSLTYFVSAGGQDSADAVVTLSIDPVNDRPVADDQSRSTPEDTGLAITLSGYDVEGSSLSFAVENGPYNGLLTGTPPNLTYTPNPLFNGVDFFTFHASDGTDNSNAASVLISVYDAAAPADVTGFKALGGDGQVTLSWSNPTDADLRGVRVRRDTGGFPTGPTSGTQVYDAPFGLTSFLDTGLINGTTYYYVAFAFDDAGKFAAGASSSDLVHVPFTLPVKELHASSIVASDNYGKAVAISGDYAIASTRAYGEGAFVYHRDPLTDDWDAGTMLAVSGASLGNVVSISGDDAIVGIGNIPGDYVFHRTGTNAWDGGTLLAMPDPNANNFGESASISGDYAIVGAWQADNGAADAYTHAGAAWVFHRDPNSGAWDGGAKLIAPDRYPSDAFGWSVGIDGDYAIVGAQWADGSPGSSPFNAGAAYVFHRTGTNSWDAGTKLRAIDAQTNGYFGWAVAINGDYAVVGAINSFSAYVYHRIGTNDWDPGMKLNPTKGATSVAIGGDFAIVGTGTPGEAAYIYHRIASNTWDLGVKIAAPDAQASDGFGTSVGLSGRFAIVGAPQEDGGLGDPTTDAGAAYLFR